MPRIDPPWVMRTYAGHSSAEASNALYRDNLDKGQTGLSVAFDLPTQLALDADDPLALGEVGRVGVPIGSIADMRALFEGIPLERMNTSMTINASAAWLLSLYVAVAEERGGSRATLAGTTQNDLVKEFLARGTYVFPPAESLRLTADVVEWAVEHAPRWNPMNVCSYHLQEAGAKPEEEVAYALGTAIAMLDEVERRREARPNLSIESVFSRVSFFVNAGVRFVDEACKIRAMGALWERIGRERYGIVDPRALRFRYGVQVNSLGLTAEQPENNLVRIVLSMLGVTLSRAARARAIQLPAWNEALGLPRPWDQQWSLRAQQILAYESDLLEHGDLFEGSRVIADRTRAMQEASWSELQEVLARGGIVAAVESGWVKARLVASARERFRAIESGAQTVVGVNAFEATAPSPLLAEPMPIATIDERAEDEQRARLERHRSARDAALVISALASLRRAAHAGDNLVPASIEAARAGVTTGEWGRALRDEFGEFRAPNGVSFAAPSHRPDGAGISELRAQVAQLASDLGRRPRILVGKPGLDGHSSGAEQIALAARDAGFEVVYEGIRSTPERLVRSAAEESVHLIGLSILSGAHRRLVTAVLDRMRAEGLSHVPVVVGGTVPDADARELERLGVARVFTSRDYAMLPILRELVSLVRARHAA
jgi:(2R)-ethylmalonyl-CoA mutase